MNRTGAKLLTGPCIGGPLDGEQIDVARGPHFMVREGARDYRYLEHRLRAMQDGTVLSFFTLDTIPVDHALSYLLRGYKSSDTLPSVRLTG